MLGARRGALQPTTHRFDAILVRPHIDRATHDVDSTPFKRAVVRMTPKGGDAEVYFPAAANREGTSGSGPKERPQIEVLHAVRSIHEVLRAALAEREQKKPVAVKTAHVGTTVEQVVENAHADDTQPAQMLVRDGRGGALRDYGLCVYKAHR